MARKIMVPGKPAATTKKAPAPEVKPAPKNAATTKAAERPSVPVHKFHSEWTQPSDVTNTRVSRTPVDAATFGTLPNAPLTERDRKAIEALSKNFGNKAFTRANIDAGILRRLGERGFLMHVSGGVNEATATFRLTTKKAA